MQRPLERGKLTITMSSIIRLVMIALLAVVLLTASSLAQAPGYLRGKFVKASLMAGAGGGSGVLSGRRP